MNGGKQTLTRTSVPPEIRFERFVDRTETCWEWTGFRDPDGYGVFRHPKTRRAHRASYLMFVGGIDTGLVIDHLCRNRGCVNPTHLEAVSVKENTLRGDTLPAENSRKSECPQGHPYAGENLIVTKLQRMCRTCHQESSKRYDERNREKRKLDARERRQRNRELRS